MSLPGIIKYIVNGLAKGGAGAVQGIAALLKPVPLKPKPRAEQPCNKTVLLRTKIILEHLSQKLPNCFLTQQRAKKTHLSPFT